MSWLRTMVGCMVRGMMRSLVRDIVWSLVWSLVMGLMVLDWSLLHWSNLLRLRLRLRSGFYNRGRFMFLRSCMVFCMMFSMLSSMVLSMMFPVMFSMVAMMTNPIPQTVHY